MKTGKFIVAALVCMFFLNTTMLLAQETTKSFEEVMKLMAEQFAERLEMGEKLEKQLSEINLKYLKNGKESKEDTSSNIQRSKRYMADSKGGSQEVKGILTTEQFKEWEELSEQIKKEMDRRFKK